MAPPVRPRHAGRGTPLGAAAGVPLLTMRVEDITRPSRRLRSVRVSQVSLLVPVEQGEEPEHLDVDRGLVEARLRRKGCANLTEHTTGPDPGVSRARALDEAAGLWNTTGGT